MISKNLGLIKANFNYDLIGEYKNKNQHGVEIGQDVLESNGDIFAESF